METLLMPIFGTMLTALVVGSQFWMHRDLKADIRELRQAVQEIRIGQHRTDEMLAALLNHRHYAEGRVIVNLPGPISRLSGSNQMNQPNPVGEQTLAAYVVLVMCAGMRSTITYGRLGQLVGTMAQHVAPLHLIPIFNYCQGHNLPHLTTLVVYQCTGVPGYDFGPNLYEQREDVYGHDWFNAELPTIHELMNHGQRLHTQARGGTK